MEIPWTPTATEALIHSIPWCATGKRIGYGRSEGIRIGNAISSDAQEFQKQ